jgi:hypothetical protein
MALLGMYLIYGIRWELGPSAGKTSLGKLDSGPKDLSRRTLLGSHENRAPASLGPKKFLSEQLWSADAR